MYMCEAEICSMYNNAMHKKRQIRILADLNLCESSEIVKVLQANGIRVEGSKKDNGRTTRGHLRKMADKNNYKTINLGSKAANIPKAIMDGSKKMKEQNKPTQDTAEEMPDIVRQALYEKIEQLENLIAERTREKELLEQEIKDREKDYVTICSYLGANVPDGYAMFIGGAVS